MSCGVVMWYWLTEAEVEVCQCQVVLQFAICNGLESVREILPVPNFYFSAHCSGLFWNTICVVALITSTDCVEQSQDGLKQVLN